MPVSLLKISVDILYTKIAPTAVTKACIIYTAKWLYPNIRYISAKKYEYRGSFPKTSPPIQLPAAIFKAF